MNEIRIHILVGISTTKSRDLGPTGKFLAKFQGFLQLQTQPTMTQPSPPNTNPDVYPTWLVVWLPWILFSH